MYFVSQSRTRVTARDGEGISKLLPNAADFTLEWGKRHHLPFKISYIKGSSEIPSLSLVTENLCQHLYLEEGKEGFFVNDRVCILHSYYVGVGRGSLPRVYLKARLCSVTLSTKWPHSPVSIISVPRFGYLTHGVESSVTIIFPSIRRLFFTVKKGQWRWPPTLGMTINCVKIPGSVDYIQPQKSG